MRKNIEETELGKAVYISSDTIEDDMAFLIRNDVKGVIISNDNGYKLNNVDFFKDYDFIEIVVISDYLGIDYSAIHYLKNLKALSLNILCRDNQSIDFSCFPKLTTCFFDWRPKTKSLFDCNSLKYLSIRKLKHTTLEGFKNLTNLNILRINQSSIENLDGIEKLINLKRIDLYGNRKLISFFGIGKLKSLNRLEISSCKGFSEIGEISNLDNLEILKITNCGDLESIKPINNLKNLKEFYFYDSTNILDGDLLPCIGLNKAVFQDRKHYNFKYQEIKELNAKRMNF